MEKYILAVLSEDYAKEVCSWRYEGNYSIYDFSDWDIVVENGWDLSIKEKREAEFMAILLNNELIGYGRITSDSSKVLIGIGLKPSWCGRGYGGIVMERLIEEAQKRFPKQTIGLEVRTFNKRAIKCYKKIGFETRKKYIKNTFQGEDKFIYMEYINRNKKI
ncbi:GNAT family N-acetyltransferase [Anaerosolibacter sp.]|uniref:GNAT family N-acetyltransferase n=1 Tax=Anaerosolibacter sp. TaxID=1872527 RepID=UPI0039EEDE2E